MTEHVEISDVAYAEEKKKNLRGNGRRKSKTTY